MECKAGTVVIIHYDIWHKATLNKSNINRYMFKFQFVRLTDPLLPSWNHSGKVIIYIYFLIFIFIFYYFYFLLSLFIIF